MYVVVDFYGPYNSNEYFLHSSSSSYIQKVFSHSQKLNPIYKAYIKNRGSLVLFNQLTSCTEGNK